ncbi:unnamed protein product [Effrenium voratum]|uniref:EF-hand domain-containing protein n=1 Tax=Effrenium voratum TaxID=2562239 RepID=A0AA36JL30_9DINO|nr:unnamed protein product [Effrenium voratum]CAJ1455483.1 unnamed protein product [Effrenium voratum]
MAVMPQVARHEEGDSFFDHLSSLSAAYERARAENRQLRWELAELAELTTGETERKARTLQPEAFHCAVDELDSVEFDKDEDDPFTPSQKDPKVQGQLSNDGSKRGSAFDGRRASIDSRAKARVPHAIFGRQDEIHAAIANELEPRYDVKDFYKTSGCAQWLARHPTFENVTMIIIVIYALYMSIDADLNTASIITETHPVFIVCEQLFCLYFFLELWIRFMAFERKCKCFRDAWFVFDLTLVVMMVAETWVMNIVILALASLGNGGSNFLGDASILRMARLMRLTRLLRMARLIRLVPELLILVKAIASATRSVGFTLMLLGICLYVFAIAFRMTLEGTTVGSDYFATVPVSMHSLFMHGTFLDAVSDVMTAMLAESWLGFILMYVFIILSAVTIMNMLIGILCEVITAVADAEKNALQVSWTTEVLQTCLEAGADTDNDGCIDRDEFRDMIANQKVRDVLKEVDVDVQTVGNFIDVLFEDDQGGLPLNKLPFTEFMSRLLKLRGSNHATVKDLVDLRKWMSRELNQRPGLSEGFQTTKSSGEVLMAQTLPSRSKPSDFHALMPGQVPDRKAERLA